MLVRLVLHGFARFWVCPREQSRGGGFAPLRDTYSAFGFARVGHSPCELLQGGRVASLPSLHRLATFVSFQFRAGFGLPARSVAGRWRCSAKPDPRHLFYSNSRRARMLGGQCLAAALPVELGGLAHVLTRPFFEVHPWHIGLTA